MKNVHLCELSQKKVPLSAVGENFHFFRFFKKNSKMKKTIIIHSRTTKL